MSPASDSNPESRLNCLDRERKARRLGQRSFCHSRWSIGPLLVSLLLLALPHTRAQEAEPANFRRPVDEADLRDWLENMVWYHRFSKREIALAIGLKSSEIDAALQRFSISASTRPWRPADAPLLVLPYPGGRHPRIGFLEGAVRPQRETKVSVFTPWDPASYVVVDVPEAIWSNLGLTYLAHTHVPTIWTQRGITLEPLEWNRRDDGSLDVERTLPNGIVFGAKVVPGVDAVRIELWLTNGTRQTLMDLRVQNCVMLKGAAGFAEQIKKNKVFSGPYAAAGNQTRDRWVITAWEPYNRTWDNARCPCVHSDPKFPDCKPGETVKAHGWLSFYEGRDVQEEIRRIKETGWQAKKPDAEQTN